MDSHRDPHDVPTVRLPEPPSGARLTIDGCSLAYDYVRDPTADTTLVFVHGWMDTLHDSDANVGEVGRAYNVLRFDLPGHGLSDGLPAYSVSVYATYAAALIEALDPPGPVLLGHSMGAMVVIELNRRDPGAFPLIILIDPPISGVPRITAGLAPVLASLRRAGLLKPGLRRLRRSARFQRRWCNYFVGPAIPANLPARLVNVYGMQAADIDVVATGASDVIRNRMVVTAPPAGNAFHVVYGELDPVLRRTQLQRMFQPNRIHEIAGARHTPNRTHAPEFNAIVAEIVETEAASAGRRADPEVR